MSILSACAWLTAELMWHLPYPHPFVPFWNAAIRLGIFVIVASLLSALKEFNEQLEEKVNERTAMLTAEIAERERAEVGLRKSEERFRAIFESTKDCILVWDRDYNYLYVNQAAIDHVGTTRDKVIGKNMRDGLGHIPDFMRLWMKRVDQVFASGKPMHVEDAIMVGNRLVNSESVLSPIRDAEGKIFAVGVVYRDVSERARAEEALRASEDKYRAVADNTYAWEFWMDPDGRLIYSSPSCKRITGYTSKEFEADPGALRAIVHPDDLEIFESHEQEKDRGNIPTEIEFRIIHRNGSVRWISHVCQQIYDTDGRYLGTRGSNRDITEHKVAEETLRESEEKYRALMDGAVDAILLANTDGYLLEANEKALKLFGYSKNALVGMHFTHLHPEQERARVDADFKGAVESGRGFLTDGIVLRKDGKLIPVDINTSIIEYAGKKVLQGIFRDISERKRIEQMKDNLIRDVSHELKAPIAMMQMAFAMGEKAIAAKNIEEIKNAWRISSRNLRTLSKDVNNILGMFSLTSRGVIPQWKQVSLRMMVAEIIGDLRDIIAQRKLRIKIDIPPNLDKIHADRRMIRTLVYNIIDNAIKFTRRGTISITVGAMEEELHLKVKDTGRGIELKDKSVLFTRFFKQDPAIQGTGLGLAICKEIAEVYGGAIEVASAGAGKGTTVTVKLPRTLLSR